MILPIELNNRKSGAAGCLCLMNVFQQGCSGKNYSAHIEKLLFRIPENSPVNNRPISLEKVKSK